MQTIGWCVRIQRKVHTSGNAHGVLRVFLVGLILTGIGATSAATSLTSGFRSANTAQQGPSVTFLNPPDGAEVRPASQLSITAQITDNDGVASAEIFWQATGNALPCPGTNNNDWRCSKQNDTYTWVLDLSPTEGVRTYHIRTTDSRGHQTITPSRTIRVTSQLTGLAISLLSPRPGSTIQPGTSLTFSAEVRATGTSVRAVEVRSLSHPIAYALSPDPARPNAWQLAATVSAQAPAGEHTFFIEATNQSGAIATVGPIRLIIQGTNGSATGNFPIFRYRTSTIDDARADLILGRANQILATNDGSYDVSCPLTPPLARRGNVDVFTFTDGNIDTRQEMATLLNRPGGGAYVVNEINYCGGFPTPGFTILGCADTDTPIVVVRRSDLQTEAVLWAHEYGHVKGLGHWEDLRNIMRSHIGTNHTMVYDWQCRSYQHRERSAPQLDPQPVRHLGKVIPQQTQQRDQQVPVLEFIKLQFIQGVPFEQAARYSTTDVPVLLRQLAEPSPGVYLPTLVGTLGVIGDTQAIQPLIAFIERGRGQLSDEMYGAKKAALLALGHIAAQRPAQRAIDYLTQGMDPRYWERTLQWQLPYEATRGIRNWQMVKAAAWGLGFSGHLEGARTLEQAQTRAKGAIAEFPQDLPDLLQEALKVNNLIRELGGLRQFYIRNK